MGFPNVDPNAIREQQQLQRMQALEQSKRASPISGKKMLLILVPILAVALVLVHFSVAYSAKLTRSAGTAGYTAYLTPSPKIWCMNCRRAMCWPGA